MKINQNVKTKYKNRQGKIIDIERTEGFLPEYLVVLRNGKRMVFYESELELINVQSK